MTRETKYEMRDKRYESGFTLVELLIALIVTGIILAAVAALAYALGTANETSDDTSQKQAQVRYATLRISELIKHSKLVCSASESNVVLWGTDKNKDGQIDDNERVYIDAVPADGYIQLQLREGSGDAVVLIPQCSNVQFRFDVSPPSPLTECRFVSISFELSENGVARQYQISATLRCKAG